MSSNKISLKSAADIERLKKSGRILSKILETLTGMLKPGAKGGILNKRAEELAAERGASCSFKGFEGYPANICLSRNNEIVHGFPFDKVIEEGDIVGLDLGIKYKGFFTDSAVTVVIPYSSVGTGLRSVPTEIKKKQRLANTAFDCLKNSLKFCTPGYRLGDIGHSIQDLAEKRGYSVVKNLVGHGVGYTVHEAPLVPNYGKRGSGIRLQPGMVLAIEPMVNAGTDNVVMDKNDGWTFLTADGSPSAHFEWTVAITNNEPIVLTPLDWVENEQLRKKNEDKQLP